MASPSLRSKISRECLGSKLGDHEELGIHQEQSGFWPTKKKNWFCQERMVFWRSVNTAVWFNLNFQDQSAGFFTKQTNKWWFYQGYHPKLLFYHILPNIYQTFNQMKRDFTSSDDMEFNLLWLIWNMMTDHWIFRLRHAMCEVKIGSEPAKVRDSNHSNR